MDTLDCEILPFNIITEEVERTGRANFGYKLLRGELHHRTGPLRDGGFPFSFYGTREGATITPDPKVRNTTYPLTTEYGAQTGLILPFPATGISVCGNVRALFFSTGEVFVESLLLRDEPYLQALHYQIAPRIQEMFNDRAFLELYRSRMQSLRSPKTAAFGRKI